jgi:hypothetical protein
MDKKDREEILKYIIALRKQFQSELDIIQKKSGPKGDTGEIGKEGIQGVQGEIGSQGNKGEKGEKGDKGDPGKDGAILIKDFLKGDKGDKGEKGESGKDGAVLVKDFYKGDIGKQGPRGLRGLEGKQGIPGNTVWVAFATDGLGTNFTLTKPDENSNYVAFLVKPINEAPPKKEEFRGLWINFVGLLDTRPISGGEKSLNTVNALATYKSKQHMHNLFNSVGILTGGVISNGGSGQLDITAMTGVIRASDDITSDLLFFDLPATSATLTDNTLNYIYIEYNNRSPQLVVTTSEKTDYNTNIFLGRIYRCGTLLHINTLNGHYISNSIQKIIIKDSQLRGIERESGGSVSEAGTRGLAITEAKLWCGVTNDTFTAFDTSASDEFTSYYRNGAGGWTEETSATQLNNVLYDDGDGTLASASQLYIVHWVYIATDDHVHTLYGQDQYANLNLAQEAQPPSSIPPCVLVHSVLAAKIIIAKGGTNFTQIQSAFETTFTSNVADHGDLTGLADDDHTQYLIIAERPSAQGDIVVHDGSAVMVLGPGSSGQVLTVDTSAATGLAWAAGGGGGFQSELNFPVAGLMATEANFAPIEHINGTNADILVRAFDDTTEEFANGYFITPNDINTAGTITFRAYVRAKTAAASKNVELNFGHIPLNDSEAEDAAYTDVNSGDKAIDATQGDITEITWTATASTLGWAANDMIMFRISRIDASANDLTGDMYWHIFRIEIPRS